MPDVAFKEWAVVCDALATGRQSVLIRKGGIAEVGGEFCPEHREFWLYPTLFHEQQSVGVKAEAQRRLAEVEAARPPAGTVSLQHFCSVSRVFFLTDLSLALALDDLHIWTPQTVTQRFHYRQPGLFVLAVRVFEVPPRRVPELPEYAGCKTWVPLVGPPPVDAARPVISDALAAERIATLEQRLCRG
jgi:hypothetical protein